MPHVRGHIVDKSSGIPNLEVLAIEIEPFSESNPIINQEILVFSEFRHRIYELVMVKK